MYSEPDQDIHLAGKTNKQMNTTQKSLEGLFCFDLGFWGRWGKSCPLIYLAI